MASNDFADLIHNITSAQTIYMLTIAKALQAKGVTTVDELTRFMEEINGGDGNPTNPLVENMIDAMRAHMME